MTYPPGKYFDKSDPCLISSRFLGFSVSWAKACNNDETTFNLILLFIYSTILASNQYFLHLKQDISLFYFKNEFVIF